MFLYDLCSSIRFIDLAHQALRNLVRGDEYLNVGTRDEMRPRVKVLFHADALYEVTSDRVWHHKHRPGHVVLCNVLAPITPSAEPHSATAHVTHGISLSDAGIISSVTGTGSFGVIQSARRTDEPSFV